MKHKLLLALLVSVTAHAEVITTDSTSVSTVNSRTESISTIKSPPASAISPSISTSNSDLCTVGVSGAV